MTLSETIIKTCFFSLGLSSGSFILGRRFLPHSITAIFFFISLVFCSGLLLGNSGEFLSASSFRNILEANHSVDALVWQGLISYGVVSFVSGFIGSIISCFFLLGAILSASWLSGLVLSGPVSNFSIREPQANNQPLFNFLFLLSISVFFSSDLSILWLSRVAFILPEVSLGLSGSLGNFIFFVEQTFWLALLITLPAFVASLAFDLLSVVFSRFASEFGEVQIFRPVVILAVVVVFVFPTVLVSISWFGDSFYGKMLESILSN